MEFNYGEENLKDSQQNDRVTKEGKPVLDVNADIAAIRKILRNYESGFNTGDFDSWLSLWTDDGVRMPPNAPTRIGVAQITEELKPIFDQFTFDIKINSIEDAKIFGDIGITRCCFNVALTPKAGGEKVTVLSTAKALTISKKQLDGSWKIIYDCFNSNIPPDQ